MGVFIFAQKRGKLFFTAPGNRLRIFETDGDLLAEDGTASDEIRVKITETGEFLLFDVPYTDVKQADGSTNWGASRDAAKNAINGQLFNRGLIYQLGLGQLVINDSGATMTKGTPAVVKGLSNAVVTIEPAKSSDSTKMPAVYVLLEDIADGVSGEVASYGLLTDFDTSAYAVGTKLYVAPAGTWTNVAPTGSNIAQVFATVQVQSSTQGQLLIQNLGNDESRLSDVAISGDYDDLSNTPTIPSDTNLGNSDQTVSGNRAVNLGGSNTFSIKCGTSNTLSPLVITPNSNTPATIHFNGDLRFDSGLTAGGMLKLEEFAAAGNNFVALKAPTTLSGDTTFVLPATDGSAGQFIKTDGNGNLSFDSAGGGGSSTIKHFYSGGAQLAYPFARYLPLTGDVIEQNTASSALSRTGFVAPYDGEVTKIIARSQETLGNTVLQWYKATDGTHAPATSLQSVTVNINAANTSFTYTYSTVTFSKGDILSIKVDPTSDPVSSTMEFNYIVEFEFDTTT